jgi:hypothetical protein
MTFPASIREFFSSAPAPAAQPQAPVQPQQPQQTPGVANTPAGLTLPQMDPNGNPQHTQQPAIQQVDPIDAITLALQNRNNPNPDGKTPANPFALDQQALQSQLAKVNLYAGVPQDMMQKAMNGDAQAFMEVLNFGQRQGLQMATTIANKIAEAGSNHTAQMLRTELPTAMKTDSVTSRLIEQTPAAKPFASAIVADLQAKNPHLSQNQLEAMAQTQITAFVDSIMRNHPETIARQAEQNKRSQLSPNGTDWNAHFQ